MSVASLTNISARVTSSWLQAILALITDSSRNEALHSYVNKTFFREILFMDITLYHEVKDFVALVLKFSYFTLISPKNEGTEMAQHSCMVWIPDTPGHYQLELLHNQFLRYDLPDCPHQNFHAVVFLSHDVCFLKYEWYFTVIMLGSSIVSKHLLLLFITPTEIF